VVSFYPPFCAVSSGSLAMFAASAAPRRAPLRIAQLLLWIQTSPRGVPGHTIHHPRSNRARAMVSGYIHPAGVEMKGGCIRITRRGRIAGSRVDRQLAEKALHAKTKIRLTLALSPRVILRMSDWAFLLERYPVAMICLRFCSRGSLQPSSRHL
jgi:hypothetical protein